MTVITTVYHLMLLSCYKKSCPTIGEHVAIIFATLLVTIATVWPGKTPLITDLGAYNSKSAWSIFVFRLSTFNKHGEGQFLAKYKKRL